MKQLPCLHSYRDLFAFPMADGLRRPVALPLSGRNAVLEFDIRRARNRMPIRTRILVDFDGLGHIWLLSQTKQHYILQLITSLRQQSPVDGRSDFPLFCGQGTTLRLPPDLSHPE